VQLHQRITRGAGPLLRIPDGAGNLPLCSSFNPGVRQVRILQARYGNIGTVGGELVVQRAACTFLAALGSACRIATEFIAARSSIETAEFLGTASGPP
jgi:hypothetical protein